MLRGGGGVTLYTIDHRTSKQYGSSLKNLSQPLQLAGSPWARRTPNPFWSMLL